MKLKVSQKNQLFDYVAQSKLGAAMYQYKETEEWQTGVSKTMITLTSHPYYFEMSEDGARISLEYSPGQEKLHESDRTEDWNQTIYRFCNWVDRLEEEVLVEDKWQAFEKLIEENSLVNNTGIANDRFTIPEYLELKEKVEIMKMELAKIGLEPAQLSLLSNKLDIVLEQTEHLGKFDWRSLFVGTVMSVILQLSLSQEQGKVIWGIVKKLFTNYFLGFQ